MFDNVGEALEGVASQFGLTFCLAGFLPLLVLSILGMVTADEGDRARGR